MSWRPVPFGLPVRAPLPLFFQGAFAAMLKPCQDFTDDPATAEIGMFTQTALLASIPRLKRYAVNLVRNRDNADDLLQSTLLRGWERQAQFEDGTDLLAWLKTIMYRIHISDRRPAMARLTEPMGGKTEFLVGHPAPEAALAAREALRLLAMFRPERRDPLLMMGMGYSHDEVAKFIGIAPGTVLSRSCRARAQLRREAA